MAHNESLGFVETHGLVAAIEAADAMVKAARVRVKTVVNADMGLLSVVCEGDLAACQAAVDAGKAAAFRVGDCLRTNLIPRPDHDTGALIDIYITSKIGPAIRPERAASKGATRRRKARPKGKSKK